ncbi:inactive carboxypeptidase-like protein X2 [Pecten maximus]|uniref:inactive carboxypeptidase-like protein X2 n=1 Tax=Pecten maximus TaxID=6579 RepID=UPI0014581B51|nr:inactive carboxypeptidase-like protein X2 [Pecten maximus]
MAPSSRRSDICRNPLVTAQGHVTSISSSSDYGSVDPKNVYDASRSVLNTTEQTLGNNTVLNGAWVAATNDRNQFIQVNFSVPHLMRGVTTQGRNGCCKDWVTKYAVHYSYDCQHWVSVGGANETLFNGNTDLDTPVTNDLGCPIWARCVRIYPRQWHKNVAMRIDLLGCPIKQLPAPTTSAPSTTTYPTTVVSSGVSMTSTTANTATYLTLSTHMTPPPRTPAAFYNTKDPIDCKFSLSTFNCSIPIVHQHCPSVMW